MLRRECRNPGIHQSRPLCLFLAGQTFFGKMYCMFFIMTHGLASRDRNASGCAFTPHSRPDPFRIRSTAITSRGGRLVPERLNAVEQVWTRAPSCILEPFRSQSCGVNTAYGVFNVIVALTVVHLLGDITDTCGQLFFSSHIDFCLHQLCVMWYGCKRNTSLWIREIYGSNVALIMSSVIITSGSLHSDTAVMQAHPSYCVHFLYCAILSTFHIVWFCTVHCTTPVMHAHQWLYVQWYNCGTGPIQAYPW